MSQNIVLIVTDQERFPPFYESPEVRAFLDSLPGHSLLKSNGVEFLSHYTASAACSPSRASLYTGHYPSLHRVTQTYGGAKLSDDPRMVWLPPATVPTMGNYFQTGGYETKYIGKWHISFEDLLDEEGRIEQSINSDKSEIEEMSQKYLRLNLLEKFGFSGWMGPDPHGPDLLNTGWWRDGGFTNQFSEFLDEKEKEKKENPNQQNPFIVAVNLVNPHDIVFFPIWLSLGLPINDGTVPSIPPPPTFMEDLKTKPTAQLSYKKQYQKAFLPNMFDEEYRQLYYFLMKKVDSEIEKIVTKIRNSSFHENTFIVFTSDHGELLGAHGGLRQKWYSAYQESIHVPLIISHPSFKSQQSFDFLSSSVDILPTILGLANLNKDVIGKKLEKTHSEVHDLVGVDFSSIIKLSSACSQIPAKVDNANKERENLDMLLFDLRSRSIYIQIEDHMTQGDSPVLLSARNRENLLNIHHFEYNEVEGPVCIEGILKFIVNDSKLHLCKFLRYWDNPSYWSHPGQMNVQTLREGKYRRGKNKTRIEPLKEEFELYDIFLDPMEIKNLTHETIRTQNAEYATLATIMMRELQAAKKKYEIFPKRSFSSGNSSKKVKVDVHKESLVETIQLLFNFPFNDKLPYSKL